MFVAPHNLNSQDVYKNFLTTLIWRWSRSSTWYQLFPCKDTILSISNLVHHLRMTIHSEIMSSDSICFLIKRTQQGQLDALITFFWWISITRKKICAPQKPKIQLNRYALQKSKTWEDADARIKKVVCFGPKSCRIEPDLTCKLGNNLI